MTVCKTKLTNNRKKNDAHQIYCICLMHRNLSAEETIIVFNTHRNFETKQVFLYIITAKFDFIFSITKQ